jgi:CDP-6-deoxy-D-xylo-4-hexulose-3-dehydrase
MRKIITNSGKVYTDVDKQAIQDWLDSGEEIPYGSFYKEFEKKLASYIGVKHAMFVNSGSSANLLAVSAFTSPLVKDNWRLNKGDEIITVAASFPTTVFPIIQCGCVPVFVDIDIDTLNIDTAKLQAAYSEKTKGVIVAHTLGNPFDIESVLQFCGEHDLFLIEDNCDAFGSTHKGKHTGSFGHISTTSMYPAHHFTTGGGGAVFTSDDVLYHIMFSMSHWGRACTCQPNQDNICGKRFSQQHGHLPFGYDHKNTYNHIGYNFMSTNIQAALGLAQLERIDVFTMKRRENFIYLYDKLLASDWFKASGIKLMTVAPESNPSYFGFPLILPGKRTELARYLEENGVQTRYLFAGNITCQPCFVGKDAPEYRVAGCLVNTDKVMNDVLWVGCWHGLSTADMDVVYQTLRDFYIC